MKKLEATYEALRKLREWAAQGKLNTAHIKHLQSVLEQRLQNTTCLKSA